MLNKDLFNKVMSHALMNEGSLYMPNWIGRHPYDAVESREQAVCNTTACFAGWACIFSGESELITDTLNNGKEFVYWSEPEDGWEEAAHRVLNPMADWDLESQLHNLFHSSKDRVIPTLRLIRDEGYTLSEALDETRDIL